MTEPTATMVERLRDATNAHDLDALVDCFAESYRNETPAHPGRGFTGREQVRANWQQIFAAVPDLTAAVQHSVTNGEEIWSEWEMRGTRPDGSPHLMRGVIIFGVSAGRASWARFYLEPVDPGDEGATVAVRHIVGAISSAPEDAQDNR
jgi:ketosteroid isomerase-like protein